MKCVVCVCVRSASSFACNNFSSSILFFISVLKWKKKNTYFFPGLVVLRKILSFIHIHRKFVHIFMFYLFFSSWLCTRLLLFWLLFFSFHSETAEHVCQFIEITSFFTFRRNRLRRRHRRRPSIFHCAVCCCYLSVYALCTRWGDCDDVAL